MKNKNSNISRRNFTKVMGVASAGMLFSPSLFGVNKTSIAETTAKVATASVSSYDESLLTEALRNSITNLGGIEDIVKPGAKVGIKINLTGGAAQARKHQLTSGLHPGDSYWTNPTLLKVVMQAILDAGAGQIYVLEALNDWDSYEEFGYKKVVDDLGATFIDLNEKAPYDNYIEKSVGDEHLIYSELTLNGIFNELDCLVSMSKAKQHATSGVTHGMKNLVGILPIPSGKYNGGASHRAGIHQLRKHDGVPNNNLCRVILDLNRANPIHLVVNDAIKTVLGSEGPWTGDGMTPATFNKLIIGKDPVAVDSVSSDVIGLNPMAEDNTYPYTRSLNYLKLASENGLGEYDLGKIQVLDYVTSIKDSETLSELRLYQNYPNPFKPSTNIQFTAEKTMNVKLKIYNSKGQEVAVLFDGLVSPGSHQFKWNANGFQSGTYFCKVVSGKYTETKQMVLLQ